jgi:hypothetical protein
MKAWHLATVLLVLLSSSLLLTQNSATSGQQQPDKSQPSASNHKGQQSIEGCLVGASGSFTVTTAEGKTHELVGGDTSALNQNVGHRVRVWGYKEGPGSSGRISASGPYSFGVKSVESLSDTCKQTER